MPIRRGEVDSADGAHVPDRRLVRGRGRVVGVTGSDRMSDTDVRCRNYQAGVVTTGDTHTTFVADT